MIGTTVLGATGVASSVLKSMCDTAGVELGSEIFGAAQDASFNGIRNMWGVEPAEDEEEEYLTEEEAEAAAIAQEKHKLKVQALKCKDMAQKATTEEMRDKFMERYEALMEAANDM